MLLALHAPSSHVDQGSILHLVLQRIKGLAQHALSTFQSVLAAVAALPCHPGHIGMLLAPLDRLRGLLEPLMIASQDIMSILSSIQDGRAPAQQGLPDTIAVVFDTLQVHIPLLRPVAALLNNACLKLEALPGVPLHPTFPTICRHGSLQIAMTQIQAPCINTETGCRDNNTHRLAHHLNGCQSSVSVVSQVTAYFYLQSQCTDSIQVWICIQVKDCLEKILAPNRGNHLSSVTLLVLPRGG